MYRNWRKTNMKDNMTDQNNSKKSDIQINIDEEKIDQKEFKKPKGWGHWNSYQKSDEYLNLIPGDEEITEEELSKHNQPGDLWIGLMYEKRVCVFDVTQFAEYHPGGYNILKNVAGRDATEDFRMAHAYVNPNMIFRFKKGYLVRTAFKSPNTLSPGMSMLAPVRKPQPTNKPRWNWTQSDNLIELKFSLHRNLPQSLNCVSVYCIEKENVLKLRIFFDVEYYFFEMKLHNYINVDLDSLKCDKHSKTVSIGLTSRLDKSVSSLGGVTEDAIMSIMDSLNKEEFIPCSLVKMRDLNYNCREFIFEWPNWARIGVPLGHHVNLRITNGDIVIQRPYTPICEITPNQNASPLNKDFVLMIKRYSNGQLSSHMHTLEEDSTLMVSLPIGNFKTPLWVPIDSSNILTKNDNNNKSVVLLAAGSGITPMIRLILTCLSTKIWNCHLMFFNQAQRDIIFVDEFEALTQFYSDRFKISNILSQPTPEWKGYRGRICVSICKELLDNNLSDRFYMICGPTGFNKASIKVLQELKVSDDRIFEFKG